MAYAALISLKRTIQRLTLVNPQITKSAYKELNSLVYLLKRLDSSSSRSIDRSLINELDAKTSEAAWKLQDVVDPYVLLYHSLPPSQGHGEDERKMEIEMGSFLKTVKMLREEYSRVLEKPLSGEEDDAAVSPPINKSATVGLSDLSATIRTELLGWQSELKTVSLVGMAGIGKTHLATLIYHHHDIVQHFDSRLWVRVGPKDQINNLSLDIVARIESKPKDLFKDKGPSTLKDLLRNSLHSRRYLIVLDDIWSTRVLDYFTEVLPDNGRRSRFLLTTRLQEVAEYYRRAKIHHMPFLDNEESWDLLWQNVFAEKSFPSQLEKPGRKIAEKCEGLPLLILAVANILGGLNKTQEYWIKVADKKTTTFTDAYDQIYKVLLSSYDYLPQHLKPCFLYMGVFPQSCEIPHSKLINLWVVEEFLEPTRFQKLEDFGMECLQDVVSKSLAIVCKRRFEVFRMIKSCKLHCVYWYLCVTEARKNNFFHAFNKLSDVSIERPRRLSVQNNILFGIKEVYDSMAATTSTARSLLCTGEDHQYPVQICLNLMLLKVLDALAIRFYEFPNDVLQLLQLRYLTLTFNGEIDSNIAKLRQLRCLILRQHHNIRLLLRDSTSCLPENIWDMKELRHLRIMGSNLPRPSKDAKLWKLITLNVNADCCREDVFRGVPNLNKLGIKIELQPDAAETFSCLEHIGLFELLESLKCVVVNPWLRSHLVVAPPEHLSNFPKDLKKLSLNGLGYPWKYMTAIASLPKLQVLKLRCAAFQGPHWETTRSEFPRLAFLLLEDIDLVHWTAQDSCFPHLRHLTVRHCFKLNKIPSQIGDNQNLETLEVDDCSPSAVASAHQIKDKRKSSRTQLVINSSWNL